LQSKLIKKKKYSSLEDITDLIGIRIITYYSDTVDMIAELIEKEFIVDRENTIDKRIAIDPEKFGYMSLHYVISLDRTRGALPEYSRFKDLKIEVQIRTILQHTWAEIEHDLGYKNKIEIPKDIRRSFGRLSGLLEIADKEFIEIRKFLNIYENEMQTELTTSMDKVEINKLSLESYIETSSIIKELNHYIANIFAYQITKTKNTDDILKKLDYLEYKTIKSIDDDINKDFDLIKLIADFMVSDSDDDYENCYISNTISIFYLGYANIAKKNKEFIIDYLKLFRIGTKFNYEFIADKLIQIYNDYRNKN
jgi:ppGpp synthetase/RelA/SpoT-type nucleotidyltranferase